MLILSPYHLFLSLLLLSRHHKRKMKKFLIDGKENGLKRHTHTHSVHIYSFIYNYVDHLVNFELQINVYAYMPMCLCAFDCVCAISR